MTTYAINICLIPTQEVYDASCQLNLLDTDSQYNNNSRAFIPHATLVMKYVTEKQLQEIQNAIEEINSEIFYSKTGKYYAKYISPSDCWTGVLVEKIPEIISLQNKICEIIKDFPNAPRDRDSYAIDDFFEENQLPKRTESDFQAKEHIHITLGKTDILEDFEKINFPKEVTFETLAIGYMGNYGSVRQILYSKKLK